MPTCALLSFVLTKLLLYFIQEEYVLNFEPVRAELRMSARKAGLRTTMTTEMELFRFLSLAVEQHLSTLLYSMVRLHLQRTDVAK